MATPYQSKQQNSIKTIKNNTQSLSLISKKQPKSFVINDQAIQSSNHSHRSFNTLKIQSMIQKSPSLIDQKHYKHKKIFLKGQYDLDATESSSKYGKNYCVDFNAVFKKISKVCQSKSKPIESSQQQISKNNFQKQIIQHNKMSEMIIEQQEISSVKRSPEDTNQSDIDKQLQTISYPVMIIYSQKQHMSIADKINYHIDAINHLKVFTENIEIEYSDQNPWNDLSFLVFKKFYVERQKLQKFLKKYPISSPFKLKKCKVSTQQMLKFIKHTGGEPILKDIKSQNKTENQQLQKRYEKMCQNPNNIQTKPYINVTNFADDFQNNIFRRLWEYIIVMQTNVQQYTTKMKQSNTKLESLTFGEIDKEYAKQIQRQNKIYQKIARAMQMGFMIGQLMGKQYTVNIQVSQGYISAGMSKSYVREHRSHFKVLVQDKKNQ